MAQPFLSLFPKLADNIAKNPTDPKYRKVRLTNPKLAEGLVHVAGARQYLRAPPARLSNSGAARTVFVRWGRDGGVTGA